MIPTQVKLYDLRALYLEEAEYAESLQHQVAALTLRNEALQSELERTSSNKAQLQAANSALLNKIQGLQLSQANLFNSLKLAKAEALKAQQQAKERERRLAQLEQTIQCQSENIEILTQQHEEVRLNLQRQIKNLKNQSAIQLLKLNSLKPVVANLQKLRQQYRQLKTLALEQLKKGRSSLQEQGKKWGEVWQRERSREQQKLSELRSQLNSIKELRDSQVKH